MNPTEIALFITILNSILSGVIAVKTELANNQAVKDVQTAIAALQSVGL